VLILKCWDDNSEVRPSFTEILNGSEEKHLKSFHEIMVDVTIPDPVGRRFWNFYFKGEDEINFDKFKEAFVDYLRVFNPPEDMPVDDDDTETKNKIKEYHESIDSLQALLVPNIVTGKNKYDKVHIQRFGKILNWLGPMPDPEESNYHPENSILSIFRKTLSKQWFHGDMTTKEAVDKLTDKPSGTFLVRFSTNMDGWFTISKISTGRKVLHDRIKHAFGGKFIFENEEYNSLDQLLEKKGLTVTCSPSKYSYIFDPSILTSDYIGNVGMDNDDDDD